jgi:hypothetical protein
MYKEVMRLLQYQSVIVSENYFRLRLESHPDYPSILSIKNTLEEQHKTAYACQGTKEELKNENKPFLAHFTYGGSDILFFKNLSEAEQEVKEFDKYW